MIQQRRSEQMNTQCRTDDHGSLEPVARHTTPLAMTAGAANT